MNARALALYAEVWCGSGRYGARHAVRHIEHLPQCPPALSLALLLLDSGMLSPFDLHLARMLYSCVHPRDHSPEAADGALQAVALLMCVSLSEGNVYLPGDAAGLAACLADAYARAHAASMSDPEPGPIPAVATPAACEHAWAETADSFLQVLDSGGYAGMVGDTARLVVRQDGRLYFQKYHQAEYAVEALLAQRFVPAADPAPVERLAGLLHELFVDAPLVRGDGAVCEADPWQQAATALCALNRGTVITGGPGTGKTTVVAQVLRMLLRLDESLVPEEDIVVCAPTGRAAARLAESIGTLLPRTAPAEQEVAAREEALRHLVGRTVHSVLGYNALRGDFGRNAREPIDAALVVVDEVSMLDIAVFARLLEALRPETRLVLLGDRHQLPSVEAGAVLGSLAEGFGPGDGGLSVQTAERLASVVPGLSAEQAAGSTPHPLRDRIVLLNRSHRSVSGIMDIAAAVNEPVADSTGRFAWEVTARLFAEQASSATPVQSHSPGVSVLDGAAGDQVFAPWVHEQLGRAYADAVLSFADTVPGPLHRVSLAASAELQARGAALLAHLDRSVMLCVVRRGPHGIETANAHAARVLQPMCEPGSHAEHYHGEPVLVTRNTPRAGLWNGDRGVLLRLDNREYLLVRRPGGCELVPAEDVPAFESSCAMTVHKSQGSEFGEVLLVLPQNDHPLLTREIVYTALTRARRRAVIAGSAEAFDTAVGRRCVRRSGFDSFLRGNP